MTLFTTYGSLPVHSRHSDFGFFLFTIVGQNFSYHRLSDFEITEHSLAN